MNERDRTFKTNVYAYFRLVKAALLHLKPGAAIIATGSITGIEGSSELPDAQPEEIAPAYVFFASDADSSYITGEVLTALGGETTGS